MNYNRKLSDSFCSLIKENGDLRWLFDFVKKREDLDLLLVKNKSGEAISVYRGLSRIIKITTKKRSPNKIYIDGAKSYKDCFKELYGEKDVSCNFKKEIELLLEKVEGQEYFNRYYNNKKEGYYQNILSRKYGILGNDNDDFVIIDKEAIISYKNQEEKNNYFGKAQQRYKQLQGKISDKNPTRFGKDLENKSIGNELDFLALDQAGNILLIEYKHGTNTSGIYLSPLQIGLYYDIFEGYSKKKLEEAVFEMLKQKQEIGLINPNWKRPKSIKSIIPILIISEYNEKSSAKEKFNEIMKFTREQKEFGEDFLKNIRTFNFTEKDSLSNW